jgi:PAS domain-containing protein
MHINLENITFSLRKSIDIIPEAILIVNPAGNIVMANRTAEKLLGYSRQELLDLPADRLVPIKMRGRHQDYFKQFIKHPFAKSPMPSKLAIRICAKNNRFLPVDVNMKTMLLGRSWYMVLWRPTRRLC